MTTIKKTIASVIGLAFVLGAAVVTPTQAAMTSAELAAQIAALQAQLAALTGGTTTTTSAPSFTRDLTIGATGADVTALQSWLISKGFSIPAGATGYFGAQTQAAVSAYQSARGIAPAAGYFGPVTRGRVASEGGSTTTTTTGGTTTTTTTTTTSNLEGTDGTISDVSLLSSYSNEEVGEGEEEVKVVGFEVEASNDGDIALKSIKLRFDPTGNSGSTHLDDYISGVKVWMGDKEIGSADADDFNEEDNDTYTKTVTVSGAVIKSDEKEKFYVTVDAVNSFDSSDISSTNDSWTATVDSIRYEDGSGVVTTETDEIPADTLRWNSTGDGVAMDFVSFSDSADTKLKFSKASDTPEEGLVTVDDEDDTDNVSLLKGKIKLEGDSNVTIDDFPVTLTTSNGDSVQALASSLILKIGDEEFTESLNDTTCEPDCDSNTTSTLTFDDLNFDIDSGDTVEFEVLADINDTNNTGVAATDFDEGDKLKASVTESNTATIDAEDEEGDQIADADKTGTAIGNYQEFRVDGIQVTLVSTETDATTGTSSNDDVGLFTIKYKIKAVGDSVYISSLSTDGVAVDWAVDKSGTATAANSQGATLVNLTDTDKTTVGNYEIEDGEEETFELSISVPLGTGGTSGQYRASIAGLLWDTSDDISPANTYSSDLDDFKTSYKVLN